MYEIFGETKSLADWSRDERCLVTLNALYKRIRNGWDPRDALTTPSTSPATVRAFGETKTIDEWSGDKRCKVPAKTLRKRLLTMSPESAITLPATPPGLCAFGETKALVEWANDTRCKVSLKTLRRRVESGMDLELALTTPPKGNIYTAFGENKTITQWANDNRCVVSRDTLAQRLMTFGWEPEKAITTEPSTGRTAREVTPGWTLKQLGELYGLDSSTINSRINRGMSIDDAASIPVPAASQAEVELQNLFGSWGLTVVPSDRTVLAPKEIDIFLPEQKIGVEFNGLYWHSELYRDKNYHADKVQAAKEAGIQLIQIWEDDWVYRRRQVERMLMRKIGVSTEETVNGRDCTPTTLSPVDSCEFLREHHIQGSVNASVHLALQAKTGEVVAVAAFQKRKTHGHVYYELVRFATSCIVRGGFSKLVTHFRRSVPDMNLVSFANLEVSDGSLYETNGWELDTVLRPDYMYVANGLREHKFNYRKDRFRKDPNLKFEEGMTERELALLNGLYRVYDSGKLRFVLPTSK